jgi:hypothetical protein
MNEHMVIALEKQRPAELGRIKLKKTGRSSAQKKP